MVVEIPVKRERIPPVNRLYNGDVRYSYERGDYAQWDQFAIRDNLEHRIMCYVSTRYDAETLVKALNQ